MEVISHVKQENITYRIIVQTGIHTTVQLTCSSLSPAPLSRNKDIQEKTAEL